MKHLIFQYGSNYDPELLNRPDRLNGRVLNLAGHARVRTRRGRLGHVCLENAFQNVEEILQGIAKRHVGRGFRMVYCIVANYAKSVHEVHNAAGYHLPRFQHAYMINQCVVGRVVDLVIIEQYNNHVFNAYFLGRKGEHLKSRLSGYKSNRTNWLAESSKLPRESEG